MSIRGFLVPRRLARLPRRTIRLRLTAIYASLFLLSGACLLGATYVLVREATGDVLVGTNPDGSTFAIDTKVRGKPSKSAANGTAPRMEQHLGAGPDSVLTQKQALAQAERDRAVAERQHAAELRLLLEKSGIALALMAAASILLGWLAAGRVLRPLRTLNERARQISASDLHKRLALAGPDDELKQLATTFDDLLGRLEASFTAQRQFVANASHELRTPLARARTLAEVALRDPDANVDSLRASHERVLAAGKQQERLIEALLTLARSERGLDNREPFDLATVAETVVATRRSEAARCGVELRATLEPAESAGDPRLAERLIANLVDNAVRYNEAPGRVEVTTTSEGGRAVLAVVNSGPVVPPAEVERLFEPFQRLEANRTGGRSAGIGLGLSIVKAIAVAHGASLAARAQPDGGLDIEVDFPPVGAADADAADPIRELERRRGLFRRPRALAADHVPAGMPSIG